MHGDFPPEFEDREKFMCDQCPAIFLTKQKWTSHKWSVHLKKRKPVQRVQCPQCTKTYKNHSYLKEHILKVRKFQKSILMSSISKLMSGSCHFDRAMTNIVSKFEYLLLFF